MSKQETNDGPAPKVYDTEKIIDIHSSESDPSLDSKKVRQAKSYTPHLKYTNNSTNIDTCNKNNSDSSDIMSNFAKNSQSNKGKDVDVYDSRGHLD